MGRRTLKETWKALEALLEQPLPFQGSGMSPSVGRLHPPRSEAARSHSPAQRPAQSPPSLMAVPEASEGLASVPVQSALSCHAPQCTGRSQLPGQSPQHLSSPLRRARWVLAFSVLFL